MLEFDILSLINIDSFCILIVNIMGLIVDMYEYQYFLYALSTDSYTVFIQFYYTVKNPKYSFV